MNDLRYVPLEELQRAQAVADGPVARASLFSTLCRINTLYMIKRAGSGHIGTSFSCIDIVSWLFLNELRLAEAPRPDSPHDVYFSSKGHDAPALYSVLIALGLLDFDLLHQLRRLNGLPGHPDVSVPHCVTNTGSLGMGISKAKGIALANRLQGKQGRVFVLTGDGELQEGQVWESLQSAANLGLGEIIAIVDHNKVQSDTLVSRTSDLGDLEAKFRAFGWAVGRCDGNDAASFSGELARVSRAGDVPSVIIADTVKGKGVSFMEHTAMESRDGLYRYHSGAPDDDVYARALSEMVDTADAQLAELEAEGVRLETVPNETQPSPGRAQRLVPAYSEALVSNARRRESLVALDADLVLDTGLIPFRDEFPQRFFECGIAEQDMVSQAGGMALRGLLPMVHSFACFLSDRPNEQIYNNATEGTKIVYVGSLAGLVPGGPGHSHQCVRDISALAAVPGLIMLEPCNELEARLAVDFCVEGTDESCYLRLSSLALDTPYDLPAGYQLTPGIGVSLVEGDDAVIFAYGPVTLSEACRAAGLLERRGISLRVINMPWLNRVDEGWLKDVVAGYTWMFTLDNHYVTGGQGDMLLSTLASSGLASLPRTMKLGVRDVPVCGSNDEVLRAHRMDAESLAEDIARFIRNGK